MAGADGLEVHSRQVPMDVDPKCHLDLGEAELPRAPGVQCVEGLPQPDQLVADLDVGEPDRLTLVLEAQLLDGEVLLEDLGGAGERDLEAGEDGDPLPLDQVLDSLHAVLQVLKFSLK